MTTVHLILWWSAGFPQMSLISKRDFAVYAAKARNATMVTITGRFKIEEVVDWYRRSHKECKHADESEEQNCTNGEPMPAEPRELAASGNGPGPWGVLAALAAQQRQRERGRAQP